MVKPSSGVTGIRWVVGVHEMSEVEICAFSIVCAALSRAPRIASIVSALTFVAVSKSMGGLIVVMLKTVMGDPKESCDKNPG